MHETEKTIREVYARSRYTGPAEGYYLPVLPRSFATSPPGPEDVPAENLVMHKVFIREVPVAVNIEGKRIGWVDVYGEMEGWKIRVATSCPHDALREYVRELEVRPEPDPEA